MAIRLMFFAVLKEELGMSGMTVEGSFGTCEAVVEFFEQKFPRVRMILSRCQFAVNGEFVDRTAILQEGDELAVLPPVSGG